MQTQAEGLQQQLQQSLSGSPKSPPPDNAQFQQRQPQDAEKQYTQLQQQLLEAQQQSSQLQEQLLEVQQQASQLQEQLHDAGGQLQQQLHPQVVDCQQSVGGGGGSAGGGSSGNGNSRLAAEEMEIKILHSQLSASKNIVQDLTSEVSKLKTQTQAYEIELAESRLKCSEVESELSETCARLRATASELAASTEAGCQQQGLLTALQSQLAALQQCLRQQRSLKREEDGRSADQHWKEEGDAPGSLYKEEEGRREAVGAIVDKLWNDLQQERVRMLLTPPPCPSPNPRLPLDHFQHCTVATALPYDCFFDCSMETFVLQK